MSVRWIFFSPACLAQVAAILSRRRSRRRSGRGPATAVPGPACFSISSRASFMPSFIAVPPGSTSNMSILRMTSSILSFSDSLVGGRSVSALLANATMARVSSGLSFWMAAIGGVLDALEPGDAGAVFLVHRAGDVEDQGEVQAHRHADAGAQAGRDQLDQGIAGRRLAGHGNAVAVHHAFDMELGRHRIPRKKGAKVIGLGRTISASVGAAPAPGGVGFQQGI